MIKDVAFDVHLAVASSRTGYITVSRTHGACSEIAEAFRSTISVERGTVLPVMLYRDGSRRGSTAVEPNPEPQ